MFEKNAKAKYFWPMKVLWNSHFSVHACSFIETELWSFILHTTVVAFVLKQHKMLTNPCLKQWCLLKKEGNEYLWSFICNFSHPLHSFLKTLVIIWCHLYIQPEAIPLLFLMVQFDSGEFSQILSENSFMLPLFVIDNFVEYTILGWRYLWLLAIWLGFSKCGFFGFYPFGVH